MPHGQGNQIEAARQARPRIASPSPQVPRFPGVLQAWPNQAEAQQYQAFSIDIFRLLIKSKEHKDLGAPENGEPAPVLHYRCRGGWKIHNCIPSHGIVVCSERVSVDLLGNADVETVALHWQENDQEENSNEEELQVPACRVAGVAGRKSSGKICVELAEAVHDHNYLQVRYIQD